MSHIFISYSHKDQNYVHKLYQSLLDQGFEAWIYDRIDYGTRWPREIEERIKECAAFILIMSPDSKESEWVQNELQFARQLGKPIYPLLLDGNVWWHLGTTQYVDVKGEKIPPKKFYERLAKVARLSKPTIDSKPDVKRSFGSKRLERHRKINVQIVILIIGLIGTIGITVIGSQYLKDYPLPTPTILLSSIPQSQQAIPTCISTIPEANPYLSSQDTIAGSIYQQYKLGALSLMDAQILTFSYLQVYTERWSDFNDIVINDGLDARITLTYISPDLMQFFVLNQALHNNISLSDFQQELKVVLQDLAIHNENVFLLTLTSSDSRAILDKESTAVEIPIQTMALKNWGGLSIPPSNRDPLLNHPIYIPKGTYSGLVFYPLAVVQESNCAWVLDPKSNLTIHIEIPGISINNANYGPLFWSIPYSRLISLGGGVPSTPESFVPAPNFDSARNFSVKTPPPPVPVLDPTVASQQEYWSIYWQDMARFIWYKLFIES